VEITFETKGLRTLCCSQDEAEKVFSVSGAKLLRSWLADARAASSLEEFAVLREVFFHDDITFSKLGEKLVISFVQAHLRPTTINGCIDLAKVYRIKVLSIDSGESDD
jgi:hypothetical protein